MSQPECRRCGRCCAVKVIAGETVIYTKLYCRYWEPATKLCSIYKRRHEIHPECLELDDAIRLGVLPGDCPYVADIPDYVPPIENSGLGLALLGDDDQDVVWVETDDARDAIT